MYNITIASRYICFQGRIYTSLMLFGYGREIQNNFFIITNNNLPVNGVLKSIKYDLDNCNYGNVQCALKIQFFSISIGIGILDFWACVLKCK